MTRWWRLLIVLGLMIAVLLGPVVHAQDDGLTDEQLAWIARVAAARDAREAYTSYVEISTAHEQQSIEITLGTLNQTLSEATTIDYTATYIQGEDYNVHATLTGEAEKVGVQPNGREEITTYTLSAEARVIDAVIYLNAALEESDGPDVPALPGGWIIVEDADQFDDLNLDDFLDDEPASPLENADLMRTAAADVTLEAVTLDDGTPADVITVTFERAGLEALLTDGADEIDPLVKALLDQVGDDFVARIAVTMDADNHPLRADMIMRMNAEDVDAYALSPEQFPEGMELDFRYEISETLTYEKVNEPVEPVEAPADLLN